MAKTFFQFPPVARKLWRRTGLLVIQFFFTRYRSKMASQIMTRVASRADDEIVKRAMSLLKLLTPNASQELVRVGSLHDGGYLVPSNLLDIGALFSPGVGSTVTFDDWFAQKGAKIFMLDASVDKPPVEIPNANFKRRFLDEKYTFDEWLIESELAPDEILAVQMDIEGGEYFALSPKSISEENLKRISWIVVELHDIHVLWTSSYTAAMQFEMVSRLLQYFSVVALCPNNSGGVFSDGHHAELPNVVELTLVRRDLINSTGVLAENQFRVVDKRSWDLPRAVWPYGRW